MKRLTQTFEENGGKFACLPECKNGCIYGLSRLQSGCRCHNFAKILARLSALEDILGDDYDLAWLRELVKAYRDGHVVVLPCKVGDSVYFITGIHGKIVKDAKVEEIYIGESGFALGVSTGFTAFTIQQNEVFFTKKAAEEALKGEQNGTKI